MIVGAGMNSSQEKTDKYIGMLLDDRYEILELIGSGGMANVYKALCHRLNRYDAIKIMREDTASNEEFRKRFRAESQAVAMLSHPNIVSVYDVSHSDDIEYIVMELIEGVTLKQYMEKAGALPSGEALDFAIQIARALAHAHDKGIIHRDIKPQNIMLLEDGRIKVADFGIASLQSEIETDSDETIGSVHYIAPEQARGGAPDVRSDIYSLGIVMYEMLTAKLPYVGESAVEVAVKHMNAEAVSPREIVSDIPEELERITLKAMASDIELRYQSAQELLDDLESFRKSSEAAQLQAEIQNDDPDEVEPIISVAELSTGEYKKRKKRARSVAFTSGLLGVLVFIILIFVFINGYFLKDLFGEAKKIDIESFVGRYYEDVINDKDYSKSYSFTVTFKVDLEHEYGIIISQDPEAGKSRAVEEGGIKIELVVSSGEALPDSDDKKVKVPDTVGRERMEAIGLLQDAGFEYSTSETYSSDVEKGRVISSSPVSGEEAEKGSTVEIVISAGKKVETTTVPQLKGLTQEAAIARIEGSGLSVGTISAVDSELDAGTVVWQSKDPGTEVEVHTKIYLQVSNGAAGEKD